MIPDYYSCHRHVVVQLISYYKHVLPSSNVHWFLSCDRNKFRLVCAGTCHVMWGRNEGNYYAMNHCVASLYCKLTCILRFASIPRQLHVCAPFEHSRSISCLQFMYN